MQSMLKDDLSSRLRQLLKQYLEVLETTVQPYAAITLHPQPNLTLWQSKFGGFPDLLKSVDYPKDTNGRELLFLAQINFSEVPDLPGFPREGILQFYIGDDDLYGKTSLRMNRGDTFKVLYFSEAEIGFRLENLCQFGGFDGQMLATSSASLSFDKLDCQRSWLSIITVQTADE